MTRWASGAAAAALLSLSLVAGAPSAARAADPPVKYDPALCTTAPSTPLVGEAWQAKRLRYPELHRIATGKGVTVAVIDTGVFVGRAAEMRSILPRLRQESFAGTDKRLNNGFDCNHGTLVVSLLAASLDPDTGFSGIAPGVSVLALRSLQESDKDEPRGPTIRAFQAAIDAGVDIISISQQTPVDDPAYRAVVKKAVDAGILVVAAAGNGGPRGGPAYPAAYPGVMAVGMTNIADQPDPNSQADPRMTVSVAAPGSAVVGMRPQCVATDTKCPPDTGPAYIVDTGTSFATPIVAGAAALVMERHPDLTAAQVQQLLEDTADAPVDGVGNSQIGHGIINPYRALLGPAPMPEPSATPSPSVVQVPPYQPDTDTTQRDTALAVAGISLGVVGVAGVVAAALPSGRRRGWRPAGRG